MDISSIVQGTLPGVVQGALDFVGNIGRPVPPKGSTSKKGSISEFMATMQSSTNGLQMSKPFLYDVQMAIPVVSPAANILRLFCHSASIPGYNVGVYPTKIYGLPYSVPYEMTYEPISFTFYVDRAHNIPKLFDDYKDQLMFDPVDHSPRYFENMAFSTIIHLYDADNVSTIAQYNLLNCFVGNVQAMNLNAAALNQVQEISVTLIFENLIRSSGASGGSMISNPLPTNLMNGLTSKSGMILPLNFDTFKMKFPDLADKFDIGSNIGGLTAKLPSLPSVGSLLPSALPSLPQIPLGSLPQIPTLPSFAEVGNINLGGLL